LGLATTPLRSPDSYRERHTNLIAYVAHALHIFSRGENLGGSKALIRERSIFSTLLNY